MAELTTDAVLAQLQPIFQEALNNPNLVVTLQSNAINTANWDSIAHIEIIEMTEMHFGIRFALGELQELKEVGDLVSLILKKRVSRN
jgi:acyl carrier protein